MAKYIATGTGATGTLTSGSDATATADSARPSPSGRLSSAATAVPQTKPSWTVVVSQAASDVVMPQIARSCGVTVLAANQCDMQPQKYRGVVV